MDLILANTINGFSRYIKQYEPDMIIIHGDRIETLAGAIVGALNNIIVAHVEGGELSGTIDESIRHSVSKLSHLHFVSNNDAKKRLIQLGENEKSIYVIGSPDIDILMRNKDGDINFIKKYYNIPFEKYAIFTYHPVTTDVKNLRKNIDIVTDALIESKDNFIVIYPNNDYGHNIIRESFNKFKNNERIKCFPSIRFEYFVELLRNAQYVIGNSSAGIHEAPVLGVPTINIGNRQKNRFFHDSIINCNENVSEILNAIKNCKNLKFIPKTQHFGKGITKKEFYNAISSDELWNVNIQKEFYTDD
jgi:UDP-N-acetylglucosamine 2-epimerase (hydrolysing)